jgi:hypothetical protein
MEIILSKRRKKARLKVRTNKSLRNMGEDHSQIGLDVDFTARYKLYAGEWFLRVYPRLEDKK